MFVSTIAFHTRSRLTHPLDRAARAQAQGAVATFENADWRAWLTVVMSAGGGSANDVEQFLSLLSQRQRNAIESKADYSFVWLMNPVLLVTIARKP